MRGKEIPPLCDRVHRCISTSVLQLQEESWDSMVLLTTEGEVLGPPTNACAASAGLAFHPSL